MSRMFIHFYRDQSPGERDGHGPVNGAISMCAAIILAISGADCAVWQIYTVHFQVIPVRRGTCFLYAREVSGYTPTKKIGAIGWGDMKTVMRKCGFDAELYTKPQDYETFRDQVRSAKSVVVLVSSHYDNTYWKKTGGHYVNISLYKEDTDEVFLADPADPDGNRNYIPLRYVYDALKQSVNISICW